ncbi:MAG: Ig-like domain-containing protein [Bacteroidales bacterium]|nr:Ig-like domain-containing protein [Bacteroidales bacterium]
MSCRGNLGNGMRMLVWSTLALVLAACASMGRPEGGARDEEPPVFLRSNPAPGSTNVNPSKITLTFNENVQLEDAFNKVIVSPAQKQTPQVTANGRHVTVNFRDTLRSNTTYTVDFADAIKDLNEGNILDGFAIDFSTGDSIDSLRISGIVLQAENLEPAQGMLVGVYTNLSDTALQTLPLEKIARTNQYGHFTIRNLKPGLYRIFAMNDVNRDYHWDRTEDIAFYDSIISPWVEQITVTDTLYSSTGADSLISREGYQYLPNDILLTWFNTNYKPAYLLDYKRPERRIIEVKLSAPTDTAPTLTIVDGAPGIGRPDSLWAVAERSAGNDTLRYWITDPEVLAADSLRLALRYPRTDTLENVVWTSDTLRFFFRDPKKSKKEIEEEEKRLKSLIQVDSITGDTIILPDPRREFLNITSRNTGTLDVYRPLTVTFSTPVSRIDTALWHLEQQVDTLWQPVEFEIVADSTNLLLNRILKFERTPGEHYRFTVDSLGAEGVYNTHNKPFKGEFTVRALEEYSNFILTMPGTDSLQMVVQLLNTSDAPQYTGIKPVGTDKLTIPYVNPNTYYLRAFIDSNPNGKWDTGDPISSVQPEEVFYFAKKLTLRKNWDVEQTWDLYELAVDAQKPYAIKKNRPKLKRGEKGPDEEDEEDDDYFDPMANPFDPKTNRNNRNNNNNNGMGGLGGLRGMGGLQRNNGR